MAAGEPVLPPQNCGITCFGASEAVQVLTVCSRVAEEVGWRDQKAFGPEEGLPLRGYSTGTSDHGAAQVECEAKITQVVNVGVQGTTPLQNATYGSHKACGCARTCDVAPNKKFLLIL